jgi:hypothetical protein
MHIYLFSTLESFGPSTPVEAPGRVPDPFISFMCRQLHDLVFARLSPHLLSGCLVLTYSLIKKCTCTIDDLESWKIFTSKLVKLYLAQYLLFFSPCPSHMLFLPCPCECAQASPRRRARACVCVCVCLGENGVLVISPCVQRSSFWQNYRSRILREICIWLGGGWTCGRKAQQHERV